MAEEKAENWRKVAVLKRESGAITTKLLSSDQERPTTPSLMRDRILNCLDKDINYIYIYIQRPDTKKFFNYTLFTWLATREYIRDCLNVSDRPVS